MSAPAWLTSKRQHAEDVRGGGNHMLIEPTQQLALLDLAEALAGALHKANEHMQHEPDCARPRRGLKCTCGYSESANMVDDVLARWAAGPGATTGGADG